MNPVRLHSHTCQNGQQVTWDLCKSGAIWIDVWNLGTGERPERWVVAAVRIPPESVQTLAELCNNLVFQGTYRMGSLLVGLSNHHQELYLNVSNVPPIPRKLWVDVFTKAKLAAVEVEKETILQPTPISKLSMICGHIPEEIPVPTDQYPQSTLIPIREKYDQLVSEAYLMSGGWQRNALYKEIESLGKSALPSLYQILESDPESWMAISLILAITKHTIPEGDRGRHTALREACLLMGRERGYYE